VCQKRAAMRPPRGNAWAEATNEASRLIIDARAKIKATRDELLKFLSNEKESESEPRVSTEK